MRTVAICTSFVILIVLATNLTQVYADGAHTLAAQYATEDPATIASFVPRSIELVHLNQQIGSGTGMRRNVYQVQPEQYGPPAVAPDGSSVNRALLTSGDQVVTAQAGEGISVSLSYQIWQGDNPSEIDQLMFIASWTPTWPPSSDYYWGIYSGVPPSSPGTSDFASFSLTAPGNPGTYYLWFVFDANYGFSQAAGDFSNSVRSSAYIEIDVNTASCQYGGTYPNCNPPPSCQYGGTYPNCNPLPTCQYGGTYPNCNPPPSCQYGGTYPNCNPPPSCQYGGTYPNCNPPPSSGWVDTYLSVKVSPKIIRAGESNDVTISGKLGVSEWGWKTNVGVCPTKVEVMFQEQQVGEATTECSGTLGLTGGYFQFTQKVGPLDPETYPIEVTYKGDSKYKPSSATADLKVDSAAGSYKIYVTVQPSGSLADDTFVNVYLYDSHGTQLDFQTADVGSAAVSGYGTGPYNFVFTVTGAPPTGNYGIKASAVYEFAGIGTSSFTWPGCVQRTIHIDQDGMHILLVPIPGNVCLMGL